MTTNQNAEEVRGKAIQDAETMIAVYGKSEVFAPFCGVMRRLIADLAALQTELRDVREMLQTAQQVIVEHCAPTWKDDKASCVCEGSWTPNGLDHVDDCAFIAALRAQHDRIEAQHQASRQALAAEGGEGA